MSGQIDLSSKVCWVIVKLIVGTSKGGCCGQLTNNIKYYKLLVPQFFSTQLHTITSRFLLLVPYSVN